MRRVLSALSMTLALAGLPAVAAAADPMGPICLQRTPFPETLELYVLPAGGSNVLISGRMGPVATGVPVSGAGYVTGNTFRFSVSGHAPNSGGRLQINEGVLDLGTLGGSGRCYTVGTGVGCGAGMAVTFTAIGCQ